jgi:hypothetical protein
MAEGFMFGSFVNIWDSCKNEWLKIRIGTSRDPTLVLIYGPCKVENCMVVSSETMHEAFEEQKLFCPTPIAIYYGLTVGM